MRLFLLALGARGAYSGCYTPDKEALQDFFKYMDGARWHHNDHWDPEGGNDPCNYDTHWYGVGCIDPCDVYRDGYNCKAGRITALTLHDNNLTGSISNWTGCGALTNLTWLDFSWNQISGSLPAEAGNIMNIEALNMAWNKIEGTIPPELGNMNSNGFAELTELNLGHNDISVRPGPLRRLGWRSLPSTPPPPLPPSPRLPLPFRPPSPSPLPPPPRRHLGAQTNTPGRGLVT